MAQSKIQDGHRCPFWKKWNFWNEKMFLIFRFFWYLRISGTKQICFKFPDFSRPGIVQCIVIFARFAFVDERATSLVISWTLNIPQRLLLKLNKPGLDKIVLLCGIVLILYTCIQHLILGLSHTFSNKSVIRPLWLCVRHSFFPAVYFSMHIWFDHKVSLVLGRPKQ